MKATFITAFLLILLNAGTIAQVTGNLTAPPARGIANRTFAGKAGIATLESFGLNTLNITGLLLAPQSLTHWPDNPFINYSSNLRRAYSSPPVWDHDPWPVNYVGHPLQGAYYFNTLRSQGCSFWASAGFNLLHTFLWEYVCEAGFEQPSKQDLLTTPITGIALGELFHYLTQRMRRGGFTTREKILVTLINPAYVINNGYR